MLYLDTCLNLRIYNLQYLPNNIRNENMMITEKVDVTISNIVKTNHASNNFARI